MANRQLRLSSPQVQPAAADRLRVRPSSRLEGLIGTRAGRGWRNAEVPNELQDGAPGSAPATRNASSGDLLKRCEEEDLGCC